MTQRPLAAAVAAFALAASCAACPARNGGAVDAAVATLDVGVARPDSGASDAGEPSDGGARDAGQGDAGDLRAEAYALLRSSILPLVTGWRFFTDGYDVGLRDGWNTEAFDDSGWSVLSAGKTWEDQGYPGYDGLAWYRMKVFVPKEWEGSAVRLVASGVDDEYDVYVNGTFLRHHGARPERSVYDWQTLTRVDGHLRFGEANLVALRVDDWGSGGGLVKDVVLRRAAPMAPYRELLPEPVLEAHPDWVALYWDAWRMAWEKISFGNERNGFAAAYLDEGFNEQIYQWDSCFISLFARHGARLFPAAETLDNFYSRQRADGYIQRVYSETTGGEAGTPSVAEPMVNPPLFAFVEWEHFLAGGDAARLARVLPKLESYYGWLKSNLRTPAGKGLYYQTGLGSGMDNTPRGDVDQAGWVDMTAQQALAALSLSRICAALGLAEKAATWQAEHDALAQTINDVAWNETDGFYYDLTRGGAHAGVRHIGAFWTMLAEVASPAQSARLIAHLKDPAEFYRRHLFPALAATDPAYSAKGHYWQGGVWAPTNYMVVRGLRRVGEDALALEAAENHLARLVEVWANPPQDEAAIAPEERDGEYQTLWECYSPDLPQPATRWDDTWFSRQDFVGWTGLGPIAMLLEDVLGFGVRGGEQTVRWHLRRTDRHGIRRLSVGADNVVDLVASPRQGPGDAVEIATFAQRPFWLEVVRPGKDVARIQVPAGQGSVQAP